MKDGNCLAVCESIHDVIALETLLKNLDIWCSMVPTPRSISSDCGMSLEYLAESQAEVTDIARLYNIQLIRTFKKIDGKLSELD